MSGQELVDELRKFAGNPFLYSEQLASRAADALEAQDARIEALEAELVEKRMTFASLSYARMRAWREEMIGKYNEQRAHAERAEQERDAASESASSMARWGAEQRDRADMAEQKSAELAAVIAEALAAIEPYTADTCWQARRILSAVPSESNRQEDTNE